jgi:hypothetical protein
MLFLPQDAVSTSSITDEEIGKSCTKLVEGLQFLLLTVTEKLAEGSSEQGAMHATVCCGCNCDAPVTTNPQALNQRWNQELEPEKV